MPLSGGAGKARSNCRRDRYPWHLAGPCDRFWRRHNQIIRGERFFAEDLCEDSLLNAIVTIKPTDKSMENAMTHNPSNEPALARRTILKAAGIGMGAGMLSGLECAAQAQGAAIAGPG